MPPKGSTKRPAKPSYLEWHGGSLRVSVAVPRDLHPLLGTRLKHPLGTDSLTIAEVLKGPHVQRFHNLIAEARKGKRMDPSVRQAMVLAKARREASTPGERADIDDLIADQGYQIIGKPVAEAPLVDGTTYPVYDTQREKEAEEFAALARGEAVPLDFHYQDYADNLTTKPRTKADDARAIAYLTTWCGQKSIRPHIHEITKRQARLFIDALPALANGIAPATVKKYLNRLSCYWQWLEDREYATANIWRGVSVATPMVMDDEKERPFTDDEMRKLLNGPAPSRMQDLMRIAALSGARLDAIVSRL